MTETVCTPPYPLWKKIGVESIATYVNFTFQYLALGIFGGSAITAAVIVAFIQGMAIFTTNSLFYMSGPHMNPLLTFSAALFRTSPRVKGWVSFAK